MLRSLAKLGLTILSATGRQRLVVFTYHRVLKEKDYLLGSEPDRVEFENHAAWISRYMRPLPLEHALELMFVGELPPRAACITFDDGYRNNFEVALPVLKSLELPATFFVTTGAVEQGSMWNDQVIEAVRFAPDDWDLTVFGLGHYSCSNQQERVTTLCKLLEALKYLDYEDRQALCSQLYATVCDHPLDLMMTNDMIVRLQEESFSIGAHTVTHPILKNLSDDKAQKEILDGRRWLSGLLSAAPSLFAYPNGRPGVDFEPKHADMVADAGFRYAVSTEWGVASKLSHPYAIPRMTPWELDETGWIARVAKTYASDWLNGVTRPTR